MMPGFRRFFLPAGRLLGLMLLTGCARSGGGPDQKLIVEVSGDKAFDHVRELVNFGPRTSGSEALEKSRTYIETKLKEYGWDVSRQTFSDETPRGTTTFVNLVGRFHGNGSGGSTRALNFLLCSHYDTKIFDNIRFVGANDGGSSTGLLIELARVLAQRPALAAKIELVFFDGEEAVEAFTDRDGLYGSRHFAKELARANAAGQFRGGILFDMVGDKSLGITLPVDSPSEMARDIFSAADALHYRNHFTYFDRGSVTDDHTPLNAAGIPTIDLIDFDYPPWHTAEDTLDKISPESLRIVGQVAIYYLTAFEPK